MKKLINPISTNYLVLGLTLLLTLIGFASSSAQTVHPPLRVSVTSSVVTAKHCGHYMRMFGPRPTLDIIINNPDFVGVKKIYEWRDLEPSKGVYDFSEIEGDLKYLAAKGKYLWVEPRYATYSSGKPKTPRYMWDNPIYGGDPRAYGNWQRTTREYGEWMPMVWNEYYLGRHAALYAALGKRFNKEPYVEGITMLETSIGRPSGDKYGFTVAGLENGYKTIALAAKKAFPDKSVLQMINYAPPGWDLEKFAAWCASNGIGIGGPDVNFNELVINENIYPLYLKYHDIVPTGPDVQWDNYEKRNLTTGKYYTAKELLQGAIVRTNPWYMFWERREPYFTRDVIPAIREFYQNGHSLGYPSR